MLKTAHSKFAANTLQKRLGACFPCVTTPIFITTVIIYNVKVLKGKLLNKKNNPQLLNSPGAPCCSKISMVLPSINGAFANVQRYPCHRNQYTLYHHICWLLNFVQSNNLDSPLPL